MKIHSVIQHLLKLVPFYPLQISQFQQMLNCNISILSKQKIEIWNKYALVSLLQGKFLTLLNTTHLHGTTGGLENLGNTCFLNSTIQVLWKCQSVLDYFKHNFDKVHKPKCIASFIKNCTLCALKYTYDQSLRSPLIEPTQFVKHLNLICYRMHIGQQEDAHEFLRYGFDI